MDMKYLFPMGFSKGALIGDVFVVQNLHKIMLSYLYKNNFRKSRDRRKRSYHFLRSCALLRCKNVYPPPLQIVCPPSLKIVCPSPLQIVCLLLLPSSKSILQILTMLQILLRTSDIGRTVVAVVACSLHASEQWRTMVLCVECGGMCLQ
jgi:hypothetical protein